MAEAVARTVTKQAGLAKQFKFDSAGTHAHHVGEAPDIRAKQVAAKRGYDLSGQRARRVKDEDFARFDYILAMDRANLAALERVCPPEYRSKLKLFVEFAEDVAADEIPDPYYGGIEGFERVLDLCEAAAHGLLSSCQQDL